MTESEPGDVDGGDATGGTLIALRHGESVANAAQRFTGRHDVDLTDRGHAQARRAAELIAAALDLPDVIISSPMIRAVRTARIVRAGLGLDHREIELSWRLVERDYGCLTGMSKRSARELLGPERFVSWRRTLHGTPPPADPDAASGWDSYHEPDTGLSTPGAGESLHDVIGRVRPAWLHLVELLRAGRTVLVVAHGNSLRALCALIDDLDEDEVTALNLPPGQPLVYRWTPSGPRPRGGRYLDPDTALVDTARIAREGGT